MQAVAAKPPAARGRPAAKAAQKEAPHGAPTSVSKIVSKRVSKSVPLNHYMRMIFIECFTLFAL